MTGRDAVAVIGMAGRFPGADDIASFWHNLVSEVESMRWFSVGEVVANGEDPVLANHADYVAARAVLDGPELFDAELLGYTGREAELTDPQQRVLAETVWRAFEDAGYPPGPRPVVGLYVGARPNRYAELLARAGRVGADLAGDLQLRAGCDADFLATRIAYKLDLRGPALTVQAACSSSLLAVHLAARALLDGECEIAVAGGVSVQVPPVRGYRYEPGLVESADGHCRPYDDGATGTTSGDGAGVVVLRRLADAQRDGDQIYAVIRGSAVNNDGADRVGFTAPSVAGHVAVARAALQRAGLRPADVSYVEGHGTATRLGDPIELRALHQVYGSDRAPGSCVLGSVKSNIGHLDSAAGVAGLVKAVLAVRHSVIPASLHVTTPNALFSWDKSGLRIARSTEPWTAGPRIAAVSSLGMGGTNVHMIIGEPPRSGNRSAGGWHAVLLSARTQDTLREYARSLSAAVADHDLADVAGTLRTGRRRFPHRCAVVARDADALARALARWSSGGTDWSVRSGKPENRPCLFAFPASAGLGSAGALLYEAEPAFAAALDLASKCVIDQGGHDPRHALLTGSDPTDAAHGPTTLLAWQYAMATALIEGGVRPSAVFGCGPGELAAACVAGDVSLFDAVRIALRWEAPHATTASPGEIPVFSCALGGELTAAEAGRWSGRLAMSRWSDELFARVATDRAVVDIGPGHSVPDSVAADLPDAADRGFVETLATMWVEAGVEPIRPASFHRISLPGHPLRRKRFWYAEPAAAASPPAASTTLAAPATAGMRAPMAEPELTDLIVAVYEEVLGTGPVAGDDDFYTLGGDSLSAIEGAARIGDAVGVEVTADEFLEHPTAASLATHLRRAGGDVGGER